ncbi:MAG TPA: flagellar basal body P-ring protein FlgI [Desulfopila sp.]|nr:flagellar basal body P-ring protein FlgI [Desulfopila sp.]
MKSRNFLSIFLFLVIAFLTVEGASSARIKDIANLYGVRPNQLIGYGLVTGLNGTGDDMNSTAFTRQAIYNMMVRSGISINPNDLDDIRIENTAAVMVTASLPAFSRPGSLIDVQVSSMGDAESLAGGTLLMTPLKGADNNVYAVAQGALTIGAFSFGGKTAKAQKNHPTVGRISNGAIVEQNVPVDLGGNGKLAYQLNFADFTTASRMSESINALYGENTAFPHDSGTVLIDIPAGNRDNIVGFIASVEKIEIDSDAVARVVVNERTGTIVIGKDVKLSTVAVSHGNLSLVIKETPEVIQPNPLAEGETVVVEETSLEVIEEEGRLTVLDMPKDVSIGDIATALNAIGATPRDLIAIFQAIKASGSMHGELVIL